MPQPGPCQGAPVTPGTWGSRLPPSTEPEYIHPPGSYMLRHARWEAALYLADTLRYTPELPWDRFNVMGPSVYWGCAL